MSDKDCGSCDYQGSVEQQRVECRVDNKWHERGYTCPDFKDYDSNKNQSERLAQALEKRKERVAKATEQGERKFVEKMAQKNREHDAGLQQERMAFDRRQWTASWWWQSILVVVGAILGFIAGLLLKS
jgi:hypothetical protein